MGLMGEGQCATLTPLSGGVSSDAFVATIGENTLCVKRALPRLRVAADWQASADRYKAEAAWMRLAASIVSGSAPQILGVDEDARLVAMHYYPPADYPLWKGLLSAGTARSEFAAEAGHLLVRLHGATAHRGDVASAFANDADFFSLRVEAYLLFTADRHVDVAPRIRAMAADLSAARIALMHGDFSPKNILCGPDGKPVVLDAETACYGDPAFDLAFCLNHLLLKCLWHPEFRPLYAASFTALSEAYLAGVTWEPVAGLEARAAGFLSAFLLARIDGKSPVEYITKTADKDFVRRLAKAFLLENADCLGAMATRWHTALQAVSP